MKITGSKPMMSDEEISLIHDLLIRHKPKHCLEWGSGNSTIVFPRHGFIKSWLSIEHDGHYLDYLKQKCPSKVQTIWILPGESYADCIQRSNRKYDFVLIDGLDRKKCLENALENLSPEGIILLHDAGRKEYADFIRKHGGVHLTKGDKTTHDGYYAHRGLAIFRRFI